MNRPKPFTVALIGADGSGKTTVARRLMDSLPMPCRYLYMGVSVASSNRMLPTTRWVHARKRASGAAPDTRGPADPDRPRDTPRGVRRRMVGGVRGGLHFLVLVSEEWYRQFLTWWHLARGRVVVYDRHYFIDYYAYDVTRPRTVWQRLHGTMLKRWYPRPKLVIFLHAPGEVLFARKGEGSVELLNRRHDDYLALQDILPHMTTLDASQPLDSVVEQVGAIIQAFDPRRTTGGDHRPETR